MPLKVGILAFQGDVSEHLEATKKAARELNLKCGISEVRTKNSLENLDALIIPGGESTTLSKLCNRAGMMEKMKAIPNIFGTCAGAIMLAKEVQNKEEGQQTLSLMDISIDRNAYGRQADSFQTPLLTKFGTMEAIFIRAPRITNTGNEVDILAKMGEETVACSESTKSSFHMAACFHPELSSTLFHRHFLEEAKARS